MPFDFLGAYFYMFESISIYFKLSFMLRYWDFNNSFDFSNSLYRNKILPSNYFHNIIAGYSTDFQSDNKAFVRMNKKITKMNAPNWNQKI